MAGPAGAPAPYRWVVLGAGMLAQAGISAVQLGLPAVAPELRAELGLSLAATGALLASPSLGIIITLLAWGALADRVGERLVIGVGLGGAAGALALAAHADEAWTMGGCLMLAGALGAAANAASGRAVVGWFPLSQRGLALGLRHMSTPAGGAVAAALLPVAAHAGGLPAVMYALAGACALGAVAALVAIRAPRGAAEIRRAPIDAGERSPVRDRAIWRLSLGTGAVVLAQLSVLSFLALYLHEARGWSTGASAAALAGVQLAGAVSRVVAGAWSDRLRRRIRPLRTLALAGGLVLAGAAFLIALPGGAGAILLIAAGVVTMAGNGVSFAAASEMAGPRRVGTALGLQNTILFVAVVIAPPAFGALVDPLGWAGAFAVAAACPLVGWWALAPLRDRV